MRTLGNKSILLLSAPLYIQHAMTSMEPKTLNRSQSDATSLLWFGPLSNSCLLTGGCNHTAFLFVINRLMVTDKKQKKTKNKHKKYNLKLGNNEQATVCSYSFFFYSNNSSHTRVGRSIRCGTFSTWKAARYFLPAAHIPCWRSHMLAL